MSRRSLIALLLVGGGCGSSLPPPDRCVAAGPGTVDTLAVGPSEDQLWQPPGDELICHFVGSP